MSTQRRWFQQDRLAVATMADPDKTAPVTPWRALPAAAAFTAALLLTPASAMAEWSSGVARDRMDDTETPYARVRSAPGEPPARLTVVCASGILGVTVESATFAFEQTLDVRYRFDDLPAQQAAWFTGRSPHIAHSGGDRALVAGLARHNRFLLELRPRHGARQVIEFSLAGSARAIAPVADACPAAERPPAADYADSAEASAYLEWLGGYFQRHREYPRQAERRREEGTVVVRFTVTERGDITDIELLESSGHPRLDNGALKLLERLSPLPEAPAHTLHNLRMPVEYRLR
ncbi:TonB family protein [Natronocella acetinitrilica]|uniref:Protein TonB n=1 Tax=Natronocella acetinitrilica TaxID=414046 RepID=A0AAE3KB78_9GAMM|nr:energy transducer TonB [Natronocella acetinitrilica]MCP1674331.1 TonB family protein [Natronocella acetinitrilica]